MATIFTVIFDVVNMGTLGSLCDFLTYIPDESIQDILKEQSESKKELARKLVGLRNWDSYTTFMLSLPAMKPFKIKAIKTYVSYVTAFVILCIVHA